MREMTLIYHNNLVQISWSRGKMTCPLNTRQVQNALKKVRRSRIGRFAHDEHTSKDIVRDFTEHPNGAYEIAIGGCTTCFWQEREMMMPFNPLSRED